MSKTVMKIHVRPVKERVAFAQDGYIPTVCKVVRDLLGHLVIELRQRDLVSSRMVSLLCRNRVHHRELDLAMNQFRANDRTSVALSMSGAGISDDLSLSEYTLSFDCNQFRVAWTDTDSVETSASCVCAHSSSLASALTAAAAMALPTRRPLTVRNGILTRMDASTALESAAHTIPTEMLQY